MSFQSTLDNIDKFLNPYYLKIKQYLNIDDSLIPTAMKKPLRFILAFIFTVGSSLYFVDFLIFYLIAVIYPLLYCYFLLKEKDASQSIRSLLIKYWVAYSLYGLLEYPFLWLLQHIPLYSYLKLGLFYYLVKNNFKLTELFYFNIEKLIDQVVQRIPLLRGITSAEQFRDVVKEAKSEITEIADYNNLSNLASLANSVVKDN